jgi:hypothetical protein
MGRGGGGARRGRGARVRRGRVGEGGGRRRRGGAGQRKRTAVAALGRKKIIASKKVLVGVPCACIWAEFLRGPGLPQPADT